MKTDPKKISICILMGIFLLGGVITLAAPKKDFSENQNRYLKKPPVFSLTKYLSGDFSENAEEYLSDHFIGSETAISAATDMDLCMGHKAVNGIYILKDRLVQKIDLPAESGIETGTDSLNAVAAGTDTPCFLMLVPTQAEIYRDELPKNAPNPDQREYIEKVSEKLEDISVIDVYSSLQAAKKDYIYYRTDHHWTTKGAYIAYQCAAKRLGYEALPENSFDFRHASNDFRGTFYSRVLYDKIKPDSIDLYIDSSGRRREPDVYIYSEAGADPEKHSGMYFMEYLEKKDKYSVFFGTNQPMITIRTGNEGGRLLIFKDSYAHCLVPFLAEHYSEITMLDTRYIQIPYTEIVDPAEYDVILFVYNVSTFMEGVKIRS